MPADAPSALAAAIRTVPREAVPEIDPFLKRFERDGLLACAGLTALGLVVPGGGWRLAAGVVGGAVLAGVSYRAIKGGVDAVIGGSGGAPALVKFFTRNAILALAAYVMLVRLRLHPVGVVLGASSLVVAAAAAAARSWRRIP